VPAEAWSGFVGDARAQVAFGDRRIVVLRSPSLAERVAAAGGRVDDVQERQWTQEVLAKQREVIQRLALDGIVIRPDFTYARVLNGFSAVLDARAAALLERMPEVKGLYPVRAVYPASVSAEQLSQLTPGAGGLARLAVPGLSGRGVTIALLDTGVDRVQPLLAPRVRAGYDLVDGDALALAETRPGDPSEIEHHGTELAGVLAGHGDGVEGVAPGATILPLRVAGWQRDATGQWAVYGRTDQLIAGLERAVDPNGDGDAHDAARIALAGVVEPFAAFADGPAADAVDGAAALDTLVVVPAGNDGPAGPLYGSVSGPGGAPDALTVAAADLRAATASVPVIVHAGLDVLLDQSRPLVGTVGPPHTVTLSLQPVRHRPSPTALPSDAPLELADFFSPDGTSDVAGRAALLAAGTSPSIGVQNAAIAGADAVLLYGGRVPAGALGLPDDEAVPVVSLPRTVALRAADLAAHGVPVTVTIGKTKVTLAPASGGIADFSSRGLAFDGRLKPEVAAPGVALPTAEPGTHEDGSPRLGTVNGSSAAAAAVAGAAALLAQARPSLDAEALKALLVGSARPLQGVPVTAQGAGFVDVGAAVASEVAASPSALVFGPLLGQRAAAQTLTLANVSVRALALAIDPAQNGAVAVSASPSQVRLAPGASTTIHLVAGARRPAASGEAVGVIRIVPQTGVAQRVLWSATLGRPDSHLLASATLAVGNATPKKKGVLPAFHPSDSAPADLSLRVGRVAVTAGRLELSPVSRLDVDLVTASGDDLGLLARLRDLLPGNYVFGLTGRGPGGNILPSGRYRLRIAAFPTTPGPAARRAIPFRIK